jgi:hypothetical protein
MRQSFNRSIVVWRFLVGPGNSADVNIDFIRTQLAFDKSLTRPESLSVIVTRCHLFFDNLDQNKRDGAKS